MKFIQDHWALLIPLAAFLGLTILVVRALRVTRGDIGNAFSLISGDNFFAAVMFLAVSVLPWFVIAAWVALLPEVLSGRAGWSPSSRTAAGVLLAVLLILAAAAAPAWTLIAIAFLVLVRIVMAIEGLLVRGFWRSIAKSNWKPARRLWLARRKVEVSIERDRRARERNQISRAAKSEDLGEPVAARVQSLVRATDLAYTLLPILALAGATVGVAALGTDIWIPAERVEVNGPRTVSGVYLIDESEGWVRVLHSDGDRPELIRAGDILSRTLCAFETTFPAVLSAPLGVASPQPLPKC